MPVIRIHTAHELRGMAAQVLRMIATGLLEFVRGDHPSGFAAHETPWPGDYVETVVECSSCGQRFRLCAETYHGAGGSWEALEDTTL